MKIAAEQINSYIMKLQEIYIKKHYNSFINTLSMKHYKKYMSRNFDSFILSYIKKLHLGKSSVHNKNSYKSWKHETLAKMREIKQHKVY